MRDEYLRLKTLLESPGYKDLEALWFLEVATMEQGRSRAAARGQESAWRFFAGKEEGYKLAMTRVARALLAMEGEDDGLESEAKFDEIMSHIRGEKK